MANDLGSQVPLGLNPADYTLAQLQAAYQKATAAGDNNASDQLHQMISGKIEEGRKTAAESMGGGEQFARGYAQAIPRMLEGGANWLGAKGTFAGLDSTDEGLRKQDEANRALLNTTAGSLGNIAGQVVGTAPLGMGTGAALRGGGAVLGRFAPQILTRAAALAREYPNLTPILKNALRIGEGAGQGAVQSGAMAAPGEQGEAAGRGAELGAVLGAGTQAGGRILSGAVQKSPAAQMLIEEAKKAGQRIFLPISVGAAEGGLSGAIGSAYKNLLPLGIGVGGRLERQTQKAVEGTEQAYQNIWETRKQAAQTTAQEHAAGLKDSFDNYTFKIPLDYEDQVSRYLTRMHPGMPDADKANLVRIMTRNISGLGQKGEFGAEISGADLRSGLSDASSEIDKLGNIKAPWKNSSLQTGRDIIDQAIAENEDIARTSTNLNEVARAKKFNEDMQRYKGLADKDADVANMVRDTEGAPPAPGDYTFSSALRNEVPGSPAHRLLSSAHDVFESGGPAEANPGLRQLLYKIGSGLLPFGSTGAGMYSGHGNIGLLGTLAGEGAATVGSLQGPQRALYGDLGIQQALANYLRGAGGQALGAAGRAGVIANQDQPQKPPPLPYLLPEEAGQ